jgi:XamI restriction endonuclease
MVKDRLIQVSFQEVPPRDILTLDQAPALGEFCGESLFGSRKADIVIRLWDRRVLALECKVSNSSTNSIKRLNNDAAVKASVWLSEFGTAQTVPAAMLAGVFKRNNLKQAQDRGLTLFWSHDLDELVAFIESTRA